MKLTLGTTELADVSDDVARQLLALFERPGRLERMPEAEMRRPNSFDAPLKDSHFVQLVETQDFDVRLSIRATVERLGPLLDARDLFGDSRR